MTWLCKKLFSLIITRNNFNDENMKIFDITLDRLNYTEFFSKITKFENQSIIFTPNPEILLKTQKDEEFKNLIQQADYKTPDGMGLYLGFQMLEEKNRLLRFLKTPYYLYKIFFHKHSLYKKYWDRICGSDLTSDLLYFCENKSVKITILDLYNPTDKNKVASQKNFSKLFQKKFPELKFDFFIYNPEKKSEILEQIKSSDSQIVFSTLWMKKQEKSVIEVMQSCPNIKLWLWIWSSFDYFIGFQKRAPDVFKKLWFEWLYRIFTGPQKIKRLKRVYNAIVVFYIQVLKQK